MWADWLQHRNTTDSAISSGNAIRWMEIIFGSAPPNASQAALSVPCCSTRLFQNGIFCHIGVTTPAGDTQFTRMPGGFSSSAAARANIRIPALLAQYALA